jgi:hypothetical protein
VGHSGGAVVAAALQSAGPSELLMADRGSLSFTDHRREAEGGTRQRRHPSPCSSPPTGRARAARPEEAVEVGEGGAP